MNKLLCRCSLWTLSYFRTQLLISSISFASRSLGKAPPGSKESCDDAVRIPRRAYFTVRLHSNRARRPHAARIVRCRRGLLLALAHISSDEPAVRSNRCGWDQRHLSSVDRAQPVPCNLPVQAGLQAQPTVQFVLRGLCVDRAFAGIVHSMRDGEVRSSRRDHRVHRVPAGDVPSECGSREVRCLRARVLLRRQDVEFHSA